MRFILATVVLFGLLSCDKGKRTPIITTSAIYEVFPKTAKGGGILYSEGNAKVTEKGLCWNTMPEPTVDNFKTVVGEGEGNFSAELTGLDPYKTYYVRAYAVNGFGISYGKETSFKTLPPTPLPVLTTSGPYSLGADKFTCGGTISSLNSKGLITVGFCWSTSPQPTIDNDKTSEAFSNLEFSHSFTGLITNTTYYVRTYAINNSGLVYGNELKITTYTGVVTDVDGNNYNTVTIGSQIWMAENLRVTKYNDGSAITSAPGNLLWLSPTSGCYCFYASDADLENTYGKLYNWQAVTSPRKIAPVGWHVPSDAEWQQLQTYLGGENVAGNHLKSKNLWFSGGDNQSGFNALPGGGRGNTGAFDGQGYSAGFWSTTTFNASQSWIYYVTYNSPRLFRLANDNISGNSIRCIKD